MLKAIIKAYRLLLPIMFLLSLSVAILIGSWTGFYAPENLRLEATVVAVVLWCLGMTALFGTLATQVDNNDLLRRLVEQGERGHYPGPRERSNRPGQRSEPMLQRREPTV